MKTHHVFALLLWATFINGLFAENADDYLNYTIPTDAKKIGPFGERKPNETYCNYLLPRIPKPGQSEWNKVGDETYFDGRLVGRSLYKDGAKHGVQRTWYPNGQPCSESPYNNGVMHGTFREWNKLGQLTAKYEIRNGNGTKKIYDDKGKLVFEEELENSEGNGLRMEVMSSNPASSSLSLFKRKNDKFLGMGFEFYPTDRISEVLSYSADGVPHGPWIDFSNNGTVTKKKWYVNYKVVTEAEYAKAAVSDPTLPPYYADATKYKEFAGGEFKMLVEKYRQMPRVKIPLEFDQAGNPLPAP